MSDLRKAAQQALEFLENGNFVYPTQLADNLRAALAQQPEPAQEPVAWMVYTEDGKSVCVTDNPNDLVGAYRALPLYTAPPQRPPLTDEEIAQEVYRKWGMLPGANSVITEFARAIERKVRGEKE